VPPPRPPLQSNGIEVPKIERSPAEEPVGDHRKRGENSADDGLTGGGFQAKPSKTRPKKSWPASPDAEEVEMIDLVGEYCAAMRRMPLSAAQELHSTFDIPWRSIAAACPVPTRARFTDKARSLFEPDEDGGAVWVIPATCVDPARPEEIEAVDPLDVVRTGPIVDLVAFHPDRRNRFALRIGHAVVLGAVEPQCCEPARVKVWSDIGDWLREGCHGIVLLTPDDHQRGRILRRIESIEAAQPAQVKAWLALPEYPAPRPTPVFAMRAAA